MFKVEDTNDNQSIVCEKARPKSNIQRLKVSVALVATAMIAGAPLLASPTFAGPPAVPLPVVAKGTVVDTLNGKPVQGARVVYTEIGTRNSRLAVTNRLGQYSIANLRGEEYSIHIRGPVRYEVGFVGCPVHRVLPIIKWTYPVVPTWGAACSHSARAMGRIGLDRRL